MNEARWRFGTAVIADRLHVCGGIGLTSVERFDTEVGVWEVLHAVVAVLHGQLYMGGGRNDSEVPVSSVERFDLWERVESMTHARSEACAGVTDGRLFICGGEGEQGAAENSAEWFDPVTGRWELLPDMRQGRVQPHVAIVPC